MTSWEPLTRAQRGRNHGVPEAEWLCSNPKRCMRSSWIRTRWNVSSRITWWCVSWGNSSACWPWSRCSVRRTRGQLRAALSRKAAAVLGVAGPLHGDRPAARRRESFPRSVSRIVRGRLLHLCRPQDGSGPQRGRPSPVAAGSAARDRPAASVRLVPTCPWTWPTPFARPTT